MRFGNVYFAPLPDSKRRKPLFSTVSRMPDWTIIYIKKIKISFTNTLKMYMHQLCKVTLVLSLSNCANLTHISHLCPFYGTLANSADPDQTPHNAASGRVSPFCLQWSFEI